LDRFYPDVLSDCQVSFVHLIGRKELNLSESIRLKERRLAKRLSEHVDYARHVFDLHLTKPADPDEVLRVVADRRGLRDAARRAASSSTGSVQNTP
jgi:hypothetical protein